MSFWVVLKKGAAAWSSRAAPGRRRAGWLPYESALFALRRNSPFGFRHAPPLCEESRFVPCVGWCSPA